MSVFPAFLMRYGWNSLNSGSYKRFQETSWTFRKSIHKIKSTCFQILILLERLPIMNICSVHAD